jgi:hypothetical protein
VLFPKPDSSNQFFLFGGTTDTVNTSFAGFQSPKPEGQNLWFYDAPSNEWNSFATPNILRPASGAGTVLEERGIAFYFNDEQDNGSSTAASTLGGATEFWDGMLRIDLESQNIKNLSTAAVSSEARVRASMVHVPLVGSDGILVPLGGGQKRASNLEHDWKGMSPRLSRNLSRSPKR